MARNSQNDGAEMEQCSVEVTDSANRLGKRMIDRSMVEKVKQGQSESIDVNMSKFKQASAHAAHDRDDVHSLSWNTGSNLNSIKKPYPTLHVNGPALFKVEKDPARLIEKEINLLNSQLKCQ